MKKFPYFLTFSALLCIMLCVSIGYLISTCIVSSSLFQTTTNLESGENTYYLLSVYDSENKSDLEKVKQEFQAKNCAGYIYEKDERYYLVASIYSNINDAELVKNNLALEGLQVTITKFTQENIKLDGNFNSKELEILKDCFSYKDEVYKNLYDISISLDTNVIDNISAKLKINEVFSNFVTTKNNFETLFSKKTGTEISNIKNDFERVYNELYSLTQTEENLSMQIKLTYCKIILEK